MPGVLKRPEAESDLDEIWWYIAQDSPDHAAQFLDRLQERFSTLADFPKMGVCRDDIQAGLRSQPVGNDLVFYFPLMDGMVTGGRPAFIPSSLLQSLSQTTIAPTQVLRWFPRFEIPPKRRHPPETGRPRFGRPRKRRSANGEFPYRRGELLEGVGDWWGCRSGGRSGGGC